VKKSALARDTSGHETRLVGAFFGDLKGYFVEVGANDPRDARKPGFLSNPVERAFLSSRRPILRPNCAPSARPKAFSVACSSPENAGRELPFHVAGPLSSLDRKRMAPAAMPEKIINVPIRTLDSILVEAGSPARFDFLSIDVEGHEIEVLRGFDITRWWLRLILLEDHVADLSKLRYLVAAGYRIIRALRKQRLLCTERFDGHARLTGSLGDITQILSRLSVPGAAQSLPPPAQNVDIVHEQR
jgi:FkbM family methyltransferase